MGLLGGVCVFCKLQVVGVFSLLYPPGTLVALWVFFEGILPLKLMFPCPVLSQHCSLQVFYHPSLELADGTNGPANMYFGSA